VVRTKREKRSARGQHFLCRRKDYKNHNIVGPANEGEKHCAKGADALNLVWQGRESLGRGNVGVLEPKNENGDFGKTWYNLQYKRKANPGTVLPRPKQEKKKTMMLAKQFGRRQTMKG